MKGFKNVNIYIEGEGIKRADLAFEKGKIAEIGQDLAVEPIELNKNCTVFPGFIDQHIHGAFGADAMDGTVDALSNISNAVIKEGTTGFLATTMTQSPANIEKALSAVNRFIEQDLCEGARLLGVHLEGPFISEKHVGAQPLEYVQAPSVEVFDKYLKASGGHIKIVSLAPEKQGAKELIQYLNKNDIVASIGHTGAKCADVAEAIAYGLKNVTHTYNAQTALHHREVGVVGAAMLFDELNCEIICDLIHLCPEAIKLVIKNKPHDKVTLITDSMRAKHLPDGLSELGGQKVIVKNGEARLEDGTLAGSVLKMNVAIKNLVKSCGVSVCDAVDFATQNPAKNLGIFAECGSIKKGKRADFTVLDDDFNVVMTIVNGKIVYDNRG